MDLPETQYAVTSDGLYIGYQVFGSGPYDLVFIDVLSNVDAGWDVPIEDAGVHELKGVPDRWRLFRVAD